MAKGKKGKGEKKLKSGDDEEVKKRMLENLKEKINQRKMLEEANSRINIIKIQTKWREIMKVEKSKLLQLQLQMLEQTHLRQLDRKNEAINDLERDLQEAESQYSNAIKSHLMNIDTLIDLQESRLTTLRNQFNTDQESLECEFETERVRLLTQHTKDLSDIINIMARMEHDFQDKETDAKHEYSSLKEDVRNKNTEEKHALRIQLESTVEDLWRQFQSALSQYNSSTEDRKKQFEELKEKDKDNALDIEKQMKKLVKLQENIAHLKAKLANNAKDFEERNKALREEKEAIQIHFQALKRRMNLFREEEKRKLTELTVTSSKVLKSLDVKVEQAERIIRLAEMNRKLETEEEKILPFFKQIDVVAKKIGEVELDETKFAEKESDLLKTLGINLPNEFAPMEQFSKRFNKVLLDRMALEQQRSQLREENNHLRSILKQYLDGLTVNEEVLRQLNPLLVVNGKTNAPLDHAKSSLNITFVEAAHIATRNVYNRPELHDSFVFRDQNDTIAKITEHGERLKLPADLNEVKRHLEAFKNRPRNKEEELKKN
ncbi:Dynein regulatory complex subunit 2 [Clydaea vesicula]|uniref:Dynein regulatory complex subunit 2 n=1 Tax=Clydaea vesicula TaxID=447962 RepID=A0AAD5U1J1_9FUNG|nr:Dynein regulatory complex subunit 2 [Clydaea vesicula]